MCPDPQAQSVVGHDSAAMLLCWGGASMEELLLSSDALLLLCPSLNMAAIAGCHMRTGIEEGHPLCPSQSHVCR
jgi:hypothetical protein